MKDVFHNAKPINARYDIKGSWVNRSAKPAMPGHRARCRHCRMLYVVGASSGGFDNSGEATGDLSGGGGGMRGSGVGRFSQSSSTAAAAAMATGGGGGGGGGPSAGGGDRGIRITAAEGRAGTAWSTSPTSCSRTTT